MSGPGWFLAGLLVLSVAANVYQAALLSRLASSPPTYSPHDADDRAALRTLALSTIPEPHLPLSHVRVLAGDTGDGSQLDRDQLWELIGQAIRADHPADPSDAFIREPEVFDGAPHPFPDGFGT